MSTSTTPLDFSTLPQWRLWLLAIRPKTLTIGQVPVYLGAFLVDVPFSALAWSLVFFFSLSSLCIQIGTNLVNDAVDLQKGETLENRVGPIRPTLAGVFSARTTYLAGLGAFAAGFLFGIPLIFAGGIPIAILLVVSILAGYCYTCGPYPMTHKGLGEWFVLVFFGWVMVMANTYLQTGGWSLEAFLAGTQIGLLAAVPLAVDNLRDLLPDAAIGKKTMAVRFGVLFARLEITCLLFIPYLMNLCWIDSIHPWTAFLPTAALPLAISICKGIWTSPPGRAIQPFFVRSALHHLLFGGLFILGLWKR